MARYGFGEQLASARRDAGLSVQQVSDALRIRNDIIRAIELEDFSSMPAKTFARNQVSAYARYLGLDSAAVIRDFLVAYSDFENRAAASASTVTNMQQPSGDRAYIEARRAQREQSERGISQRSSSRRRSTQDDDERSGSSRNGSGSRSGSSRSYGGSGGSGERRRRDYDDRDYDDRDYYDRRRDDGRNRDGSGSRSRNGSGSSSYSRNRDNREREDDRQRSNRNGSSGQHRNSSNGNRRNSKKNSGKLPLGKQSRRDRMIANRTGSRSLDRGHGGIFDSIDVKRIAMFAIIVVIVLVVIFSFSKCSAGGSSTPDLSSSGSSTVAVTGGTSDESSISLTDDQIDDITAAPQIRSITADTFKLTVTLADGATAWTQIEIDGTTEVAESAEGPDSWEFSVESTAVLQSGNPDSTTVEVNGSEVEFEISSSGVGTLTLTREEDGTVSTGE